MAGHSRSKNGVPSVAYVPAIHVLIPKKEDVDARHKAGHDSDRGSTSGNRTGLSCRPTTHRMNE